jgi:hypothetical protein
MQLILSQPVPPTGVNVLSTGTRNVTGSLAIGAQGGNVTEMRIIALTVTKTWQGYYGNVSGTITLDDASNTTFYQWPNATGFGGEIYASRNSSPNWATINCTNSSQRTAEETYLGVFAVDGDSVTNTFNKTTHPSFNVGLRTITNNTCFSTNVFVNGSQQTAQFYQVLLSDFTPNATNTTNATSNIIYTTLLENKQYGYNSKQMDFQLMVGENEHDGNVGPTSYYFFVEIS